MLPVVSQFRPILTTEAATLVKEPSQVGTLREFVAVDSLIYTITAHYLLALTNRNNINTLAWFKGYFPVIFRHASHHVVMCQMPSRSDETIFYPDVLVLLCEFIVGNGILREDGRMRLSVVMHDVALVVDNILYSNRRGNHFTAGSEMVELTTRQWHDGYRQLTQFRIVNCWVSTQRTTEFGVEIVLFERACGDRIAAYWGKRRTINSLPFHKQLHGTVTEHPDANIRQVVVITKQFRKSVN